jgi:hypothetical protein
MGASFTAFFAVNSGCKHGGSSNPTQLKPVDRPVQKLSHPKHQTPVSNCPAASIRLEQFTVSKQNQEPGSEMILYQTEDGRTRLEVKLENETV